MFNWMCASGKPALLFRCSGNHSRAGASSLLHERRHRAVSSIVGFGGCPIRFVYMLIMQRMMSTSTSPVSVFCTISEYDTSNGHDLYSSIILFASPMNDSLFDELPRC